jgi:hypothetical protein
MPLFKDGKNRIMIIILLVRITRDLSGAHADATVVMPSEYHAAGRLLDKRMVLPML